MGAVLKQHRKNGIKAQFLIALQIIVLRTQLFKKNINGSLIYV